LGRNIWLANQRYRKWIFVGGRLYRGTRRPKYLPAPSYISGCISWPHLYAQDNKRICSRKWGKPNSIDRIRKIKNTINVALGTQKARGQPSAQAIKKWEPDLA